MSSIQKQQQKQQYSKGNNFQIAVKSTLYEKTAQLTDQTQIKKLFISNEISQYYNKLVAKKMLSKEDGGFYLTMPDKPTVFYKTQSDINEVIASLFTDKIVEEYKIFEKNLELYKTNNKNNISRLKASISIRQNRVADCNNKIMEIEIKAHEQKKIYTDAIFKNTMIQSQYTMSLHAQNMSSMNIDRVLTQSSQRNTQRVLQNVKNTLDTQKTKSQLFANVIKAKNWDFTRRVQDINDKYDEKFNEQARLLRQQTLDRQREDNMRLMAENKARAERMAANMKANAATTASATAAAAAKTAAKMDKTAAKMDKTAAKLDTTSAKLGELATKIEEKGDETVDAIDAVADSAKEVVEALEKTGKALDDVIDRLKAAGIAIIDSIPSECTTASVPSDCVGTSWLKDPIYTTARNKKTGRTNIKIYVCSAGGHYCSSEGKGGRWGSSDRNNSCYLFGADENALFNVYDNITPNCSRTWNNV